MRHNANQYSSDTTLSLSIAKKWHHLDSGPIPAPGSSMSKWWVPKCPRCQASSAECASYWYKGVLGDPP